MTSSTMLRSFFAIVAILTCSCAKKGIQEPRWHVETYRKCDRSAEARPCPLVTEYVRSQENER